jgi:hypothetical protein
VGISIIAAVHDSSKDVLPIRHLFSIRVGMRKTESSQTTMVLGTAARGAGAICDRVPTGSWNQNGPYRTRVLTTVSSFINAATGEVLRDFTLDPTRDNQPTGAPKGPKRKKPRT